MRRSWFRGGACVLPGLIALFAGCELSSTDSFAWGSGSSGDAGASFGGSTPPGAAPTGQKWEAVETESCGRSGIGYVLVDEVCGKLGDGYEDPHLTAPMFRDGALFGSTLLAVDATFLWSLDLDQPGAIKRRALIAGLGTPTSAAAYGTELLLAAGGEGLVRVDATDPHAPTRAGNVALPGFAYDVHVDGDLAYVALGKSGLGVVDLATSTLLRTIAMPGFAVGVTTKGNHAYVAACTGLHIVDLETDGVVGSAWPPPSTTMSGGVLTAPAKDVTLAGNIAYVAAGRGGAVAIDVSDPQQPDVLGNCTRPEPSFYASGVRANGTNVFVAGGEWGVLPLAAGTSCSTLSAAPPDPPVDESACSPNPPWELLPWEQIWAPPPPAKDPIQVLPVGDRVFAFGDARRIGTRAVDVRAASSLAMVARYDEPRRLVGIASSGGRVLAAGAGGGLFSAASGDGALARVATSDDATFHAATAVGFTGDGHWVAAANGALYAEGHAAPLAENLGVVHAVVPMATSKVAIARSTSVDVVDIVEGTRTTLSMPAAHLPLSIAPDGAGGLLVAAPEWASSIDVDASGTWATMAPNGVFDATEALDVLRWKTRLPRRHLVNTTETVEVAGLGDQIGLTVHRAGATTTVALPPSTYAGLAAVPGKAFVLGIDRGLYRSTLVTVSTGGASPGLVSTEVFGGAGVGLTVTQGHAYVADADGAIRVYDVAGAAPALASVLNLEEAP